MNEKVNILVVDDHPENLLALESILVDPRYHLVKAHSGGEALKCVLNRDFAVILLDVHMPGLDGFETAALIKKRERSKQIPIIFLTAVSKSEQYIFKGYLVGAVDYVFKPFEPEILKSKVSVFVELYQKTEMVKRQGELLRQVEQREHQRKLLEQQLASQQRYRSLAEAIPQIVWMSDLEGETYYYNQRWFDYTGMTLEQSEGLGWKEAIHPDDLQKCLHLWRASIRSGERYEVEYRLKQWDGTYRWHLARAIREEGPDGRVIGWLGTSTDIDDHKRSEEALGAEKERLAVTLRSIGDGVITTNTAGRVVLINNVVEMLTGWSEKEAVGRPVEEVFHIVNEKSRLRIESPVTEVLRTGRAVELANHTALIARNGTERSIADSGAPIRDKNGEMIGVVLVFRDVTEKQKIEEERVRASKLESVGLLAGGLAHDFSNVLTSIMGNIELAKRDADDPVSLLEKLAEMEKASLRAKDLTQQLLAFSKGAPSKRAVSLGRLVKEAAEFALKGSEVVLEYFLPEDLWEVEIDETQISQVIQNLVINAKQAMPQGGKIQVRAQNVPPPIAETLPLPEGRYVRTSITDQGDGIPEEHIDKIFDPYFTTKPEGTGLGLAASYSIVKKHDGHIQVESVREVGTTFSLYLPALRKGGGDS
jgi:PAS domain S-box-containing protein